MVTSRNLHGLFELQAVDDHTMLVFDVDAWAKLDLSVDRVSSDDRASLPQGARDNGLQIEQHLPIRVEEDVRTVAEMEIIDLHDGLSHTSGGSARSLSRRGLKYHPAIPSYSRQSRRKQRRTTYVMPYLYNLPCVIFFYPC